MRKHVPLGSGVVIRVDNGEIKTASGLIIAAEGSREAMAREEATILEIGEDAFDDLKVKPVVGDKVVIARYDGKMIEDHKDHGYDLRVIQDTRILTVIVEDKE